MRMDLPVPKGAVVSDYRSALRFADSSIGFPVVVKPRAGSLTKHTSVNVKSTAELHEAIKIARMVSREFIVEEHIPGEVYRVTLVAGAVAAACLREAPNVTGDGVSTLRQLIATKNADPRRGDFSNRNVTLHKIIPHPRLADDVPEEGKKVYLHEKVLMGAGGDVHDVTARMHPDNRVLCERLARSVGASLLGIDLITRDIGASHKAERLAILEANTVPYIDMHHYPVTGAPHNVAGMLLDAYLESLK
jgi:D-alanine-D-alanine ligase-like ATP-grasp enzyme